VKNTLGFGLTVWQNFIAWRTRRYGSAWECDEFQVRAFLCSKLEKGMPTWKRIKIVEGLIWYRDRLSTTPRLESLRAKWQEFLVADFGKTWASHLGKRLVSSEEVWCLAS